jgi:hypothetical protein
MFTDPLNEALKKMKEFFSFSKKNGFDIPSINKNYDENGDLVALPPGSMGGGSSTMYIGIENNSGSPVTTTYTDKNGKTVTRTVPAGASKELVGKEN